MEREETEEEINYNNRRKKEKNLSSTDRGFID